MKRTVNILRNVMLVGLIFWALYTAYIILLLIDHAGGNYNLTYGDLWLYMAATILFFAAFGIMWMIIKKKAPYAKRP